MRTSGFSYAYVNHSLLLLLIGEIFHFHSYYACLHRMKIYCVLQQISKIHKLICKTAVFGRGSYHHPPAILLVPAIESCYLDWVKRYPVYSPSYRRKLASSKSLKPLDSGIHWNDEEGLLTLMFPITIEHSIP